MFKLILILSAFIFISCGENKSKKVNNFDILTDRKPYKPHLTLLKIKGKTEEGFIESITSYKFETISFLAQEIVLYESALNVTGSTYKRLKTIYLST